MANLTRILNNQIYSKTIIASQKIADGTITGTLFASNVTVPGDFLITGNLFVLGSSQTTTIASTNTYVNDPLVVLNNGFAGTNTYDEGLVFNRGSADNKAFIWSETFKEFRLITTSEGGTTYGNITSQLGLANLSLGKFNAAGVATVGSFTTLGKANVGDLNATGNVLASTLIASYVTASTATFGNIAAVNFGNASAIFTGASINLSGNVVASTVLAQLVTSTNATFGNIASGFIGNTGTAFTGASINLSGNISAAASIAGSYNTTGNASAAIVNAGQIIATGNVIGGLASFSALNATPVGNATPSTGVFTTATAGQINSGFIGNTGTAFTGASLNVTGNVLVATVNSTTENTSTVNAGAVNAVTIGNTGATVQGTTAQFTGNVIGGLAQFAALNSTPIGNATASTGAFTTLTATGNVIGGLASFASINATPIGNATAASGAFTTLSAANNLYANASIATTAQGTGAIVVPNGGISVAGAANIGTTLTVAGATQINSTLGVGGVTSITNTSQATGASTGALQVAGGASFTQDVWIGGNLFVSNIIGVTANVITVQDPLLYLRPNVVTSYNYDIGFYSAFTGTGLGTVSQYQHTSIFRDPLDNTWKFVSNLAEPSASYITLDGTTVYDPIKAGNLSIVNGNPATNATSGALQVLGGAGITGALYVGSGIQNTPIGNATASTGTFTTVTAGQISSGFIGNTGTAFTGASINLSGNVLASGIIGASLNVSGNVVASTVLAQLVTADDATVGNLASGFIGNTGTAFTGASINLTGNVVAATVLAQLVTSPNATFGNVAAGFIGNTGTAFTGASINVTGNVVAATVLAQLVTSTNATFGNIASGFIGNTGTAFTGASVNLSGNILAVNGILNTLTINSTTTAAAINSSGFINTTANVSASAVNAGALNVTGTSTVAAVNSSGFINTTGNVSASGVIADTVKATGIIWANSTTDSSSLTTGAVIVAGGTAINKSLTVGFGANINLTNGQGQAIRVNSFNGNIVLLGVSGNTVAGITETVIVGGGNLTVQPGCILKVSGATSMMVPVGPSAARPSSQGANDVAGMVRFNSTTNALEYYDGTAWQIAGSVFTLISDRQFQGNTAGGYGNVDGTNTTFTLQSNATTSGTIISINGVVQFPTLAYSVSGTILTFTEPPAPNDVIDVRVLTTTSTVSSITNGNGINQLITDDTGVSQYTGTSDGGTVQRTLVDTSGNFNLLNGTNIVYTQTAVNIAANNTPYVIATRSQTTFTSATFQISSKRGTGATGNVESYSAQVVTDGGGSAWISTYGVVNNGYAMGVLSANVVAGNVNVYYTGTVAASVVQANVKAFGTFIV
jgi:hypothetical protein